MDLNDFSFYVVDGTYVEIYDLSEDIDVWKGYIDFLPEEYGERIVCSVEVHDNHLVINIREE